MAVEQGEVIEEAAERAGLDPAALTHRHLVSIKRSLMLLFTELEKELDAEYRMVETTIDIPLNAKAIALPANTVDVLDVMIVTADGEELPTKRISRQDYLNVNRTQNNGTGTPTGWWVSKSIPGEVGRISDVAPASDDLLLVLWPAMGQSGGSARVSYVRQHVDPTYLGDDVDARRDYLELICRGLAAKIAEKYDPAREEALVLKYEKYKLDINQDRHPVIVAFRGHGWSRGRRH